MHVWGLGERIAIHFHLLELSEREVKKCRFGPQKEG